MPGEGRILSYVVIALIVAGVFVLRMRRMGQGRPLRLERLWIVPAILALALWASWPPPRREVSTGCR